MALKNQPYLPLYVQDFMTDPKLNECSADSTGVYIKIMCVMHKSEEYGKISLSNKDRLKLRLMPNGQPMLYEKQSLVEIFAQKLSKQMSFSAEVIAKALDELLENKVLYIENDKLCQKRMVADGIKSLSLSDYGKKGAKAKALAKGVAKGLASAEVPARSEDENENEIIGK